jgi:HAD superfamily hydrolase (TIGR01509 family)
MNRRDDMLEAVVFDFDGVLIDSEMTEFESHRRIYERCGAVLTVEDWCGQVGLWGDPDGEGWCKRLHQLVREAPTWDEYHAERQRNVARLTPTAPMRGVVNALEMLAAAGVPLAIASTSPRSWVVEGSERIGIDRFFSVVVCGDEVERRKPAPDVYLEAARRVGASPAHAVAVEDSAPGLRSAKAAGMKTVAIPHALTANHDMSHADVRVAHAGELTLTMLVALVR